MIFRGSMVALITPFKNGQIDEESLRKLVEFHIHNGTNGIVPCGTTGESATLTHDEHKQIIEIVVKAVAKRIPVLAGAGSNNTKEAIELTRYAKKAGADGALHITPYYNKPTQEGIYQHFKAISQDLGGFPLVPYNIVGRTAVNILPKTMARIAKLPGIVAVKEASGYIEQVAETIILCEDKIDILSGDDSILLPLLSIGCKGVISVINNIVPQDVVSLIKAWDSRNIESARSIFLNLLPLCKAIFIETNPIPIKTAMAWLGLIPSSELRLPMCEMSLTAKDKLQSALIAYGLMQ